MRPDLPSGSLLCGSATVCPLVPARTAREYGGARRPGAVHALLARRPGSGLIAFARELIATPSPNPPGDERAAAAVTQSALSELGIKDVEIVGLSAERPNLIASVPGTTGAPRLVLSGHLDTKPSGAFSEWQHDPYSPVIDDGELYGLGSGDMKGAVAAMVYAAGALRSVGARGTLVLVLTADEEAGSVLGSRWLAETGKLRADAAIIGEPCGIAREWESIDVLSRGIAMFRVVVRGTPAHSSISDQLQTVNATVAMARLIDRMDRELKAHLRYRPHPLVPNGPTVNIGVMANAGIAYGVNPGLAEFACDVRTLPYMSRDNFQHDLEAFLAIAMKDDPRLEAELKFEKWLPATELPSDNPVVVVLQDAARVVLHEVPPIGAFPGSTDATYFQLTSGIPTIAAFGPGYLSRAHQPNESLPVASLLRAAKIYAVAAARYLGVGH